MRRILAFGLMLSLVAMTSARESSSFNSHLGVAADDLAGQITNKLLKAIPKGGEKCRVAVFSFGNTEGKYTLDMGDNGPMLRSALADALRSSLDFRAPGKFLVLYPEEIDEMIATSKADLTALSPSNIIASRKLLKDLDLHVGIVGTFGIKKLTRTVALESPDRPVFVSTLAPARKSEPVKIEARVILPESDFEAKSDVSLTSMQRNGNVAQPNLNGRLTMRFLVKTAGEKADADPTAWTPLPLAISTEEETKNLMYLVVPRKYEGMRYKILLTNNGKPTLVARNPEDADRVFGASILVDGVSTFLRKDGEVYRPVSGDPSALRRYVLTPQAKRMVADRENSQFRFAGGKLVPTRSRFDLGHAQRNVLGFQKDNDRAGAFVFSRAESSIAAPILLASKKIGTISCYFYAEELTKDKPPPPPPLAGSLGSSGIASSQAGVRIGEGMPKPGTSVGDEVRSKTTRVKVRNFAAEPMEVWHIIYRYEGDSDIPKKLKTLR